MLFHVSENGLLKALHAVSNFISYLTDSISFDANSAVDFTMLFSHSQYGSQSKFMKVLNNDHLLFEIAFAWII